MPVDEFGREIQGVGGGSVVPNGVGGPFADPLRDEPTSNNVSASSTNNPLLAGGELSAPRDASDERRDGGRGEGGGRRSRDYDNYRPSHRGGRGRGRYRGGGRPWSDSYNRSGGGRGGRHRSRSYGNNDDYHHRRNGPGGGGNRNHRGSSQGRNVKKAHASERYSEQPMLCQFLWKKELEDEQVKELKLNSKVEVGGEGEINVAAVVSKEKDVHMSEGEENNSAEANPQQQEKPQEQEKEVTPPQSPLFESTEAENEAFNEYNTKYCLNHIRTFFNHHLDDPWFRTHLSPLEKIRQVTKEYTRSKIEAIELKKEIVSSLEDMKKGAIPKKDPDCAEYLGPPKCNFVASCRLTVGTKPTSSTILSHHHHYNNYDNNNEVDNIQQQHNVLQSEDRNRIERHAKSHLHSFIKSESCIKIMDVPSNVSDDQILNTLRDHVNKGDQPPSVVYSADVYIPHYDNNMEPYQRTCYALFPTGHAKECMLESLHKANEEVNRSSSHRGGRHRKGDKLPQVLDMDVNCTDIYGRSEIDQDGKGAAPPDPPGKKRKKDEEAPKLPIKRCTVYVSTLPLSSSQPVSVLSAAISSRKRIAQDKLDASTIAGIYDELRGIEAGFRLSDLLRLLYPANELQSTDDEDILDVSIAYLRRVHLFSFYNGCTAAGNVGNVLSFTHPTGTIHLRLRDADEMLSKAAEERGGVVTDDAMAEDEAAEGEAVEKGGSEAAESGAGKDLLVMRLNDSISKALEHAQMLAARGTSCLVDPVTDAAARTLETAEENAKRQWTENHHLDEDGRARCSFHFCRKLFKDTAFLNKHLFKKHSDQLRGELAKCHDGVMMAAWDNDDHRPVPPVLIDCGAKFGLVPSRVDGTLPAASDPEPALWKEEQERQAEEERIRQEREAVARAADEDMQRRREAANAGEKRKSNFIDPDDMVEEKVELSFQDSEIVVPPPKKKKKKKKSLL